MIKVLLWSVARFEDKGPLYVGLCPELWSMWSCFDALSGWLRLSVTSKGLVGQLPIVSKCALRWSVLLGLKTRVVGLRAAFNNRAVFGQSPLSASVTGMPACDRGHARSGCRARSHMVIGSQALARFAVLCQATWSWGCVDLHVIGAVAASIGC